MYFRSSFEVGSVQYGTSPHNGIECSGEVYKIEKASYFPRLSIPLLSSHSTGGRDLWTRGEERGAYHMELDNNLCLVD